MVGLRASRGALWLFVATAIGNALALVYQVVMARLLHPESYAILTAFLALLVLQYLGGRMIQSATAKLTAEYRARGEWDSLRAFVRRWARRIVIALAPLMALVVLFGPAVGDRHPLPGLAIALSGATLLLAGLLVFLLGLLQGLGRFGWYGTVQMLMAATRLAIGVALVVLGLDSNGAILGVTLGLGLGVVVTGLLVRRLLAEAWASAHERTQATAETRFFAFASVSFLAYATLTYVDGLLAPALLPTSDTGAYAGVVTLGKIVLAAPTALGLLLLERSARGRALGHNTRRALGLAVAGAVLSSGFVAVAYLVAPDYFVTLVLGERYSLAVGLLRPYGVAAFLNALLSIWLSYFVGRGELWIGAWLSVAAVAEVALLFAFGREAIAMVSVVLAVSALTQVAALGLFAFELRRGSGDVRLSS